MKKRGWEEGDERGCKDGEGRLSGEEEKEIVSPQHKALAGLAHAELRALPMVSRDHTYVSQQTKKREEGRGRPYIDSPAAAHLG